jgi:hypothetical protein
MFLKNPANGKNVTHDFKTSWGNMELGEQSHTKHYTTVSKLIINEHENIRVGVYWNDVCVHA